MAESLEHRMYVQQLSSYIDSLIPENMTSLKIVDGDGNDKPPRTSGNFVPDVYYKFKDLLIIGEAKTAPDIERKHSLEQYRDYYKDASSFDGKAIIVFCVPWHVKNTVKNIMRRIRAEYDHDVTVLVISAEMGVVEAL